VQQQYRENLLRLWRTQSDLDAGPLDAQWSGGTVGPAPTVFGTSVIAGHLCPPSDKTSAAFIEILFWQAALVATP
jgi:hypothetical protein